MSAESCAVAALSEPLAGSAPPQTHWLFVEAPGAWGREALAECSLPPDQRLALAGLPDSWRVVLVRRADRPLRRQADRLVWLSTPRDVLGWRLPVDAPLHPDLLGTGEAVAREALFVCTNGRRDRCCARFGRPLLAALPDAWECSHLGGHRFAPTAVRLSDRLVFGRLDTAAAARVLGGQTPLERLRGPAGWPPAAQAAAIAVWQLHGVVPIQSARGTDVVDLLLDDGTRWRVPVRTVRVPPRPASCGSLREAGTAVRAGAPAQVGG